MNELLESCLKSPQHPNVSDVSKLISLIGSSDSASSSSLIPRLSDWGVVSQSLLLDSISDSLCIQAGVELAKRIAISGAPKDVLIKVLQVLCLSAVKCANSLVSSTNKKDKKSVFLELFDTFGKLNGVFTTILTTLFPPMSQMTTELLLQTHGIRSSAISMVETSLKLCIGLISAENSSSEDKELTCKINLFGNVLSDMLKIVFEPAEFLPWAEIDLKDTEIVDEMSSFCTTLFNLSKLAAISNVFAVLNLSWKHLRSFLTKGRIFLLNSFPVGQTVQFNQIQALKALKQAIEELNLGNINGFKTNFSITRFYFRHLTFLCKTFTSAFSSADFALICKFYIDCRSFSPPCYYFDSITSSSPTSEEEEILNLLRTHLSTALDSLLTCIFESLYPSSESLSFLNLLNESTKDNVAQLMGFACCIKSSQAFSTPELAFYVISKIIPSVFSMITKYSDLLLKDASSIEFLIQSLLSSFESVATCPIKGAVYAVDATLFHYTLNDNPITTSIAQRLWTLVYIRGDEGYQRRVNETLMSALNEAGQINPYMPIPQKMQLIRLLTSFSMLSSQSINNFIFDFMAQPPIPPNKATSIGKWEPNTSAIILFTEFPLQIMIKKDDPSHPDICFYLSNFITMLKMNNSNNNHVVANCIYGIVKHTELQSSLLSVDSLVECAEIASNLLLNSSKPLSIPLISSLIRIISATLPYLKSNHFKPLMKLLLQLSNSSSMPKNELEFVISEFCGECSFVPLEIIPDVSVIFKSLLLNTTTNIGLCHILRCFQQFASNCNNESDVANAIPQERQDDLITFLGMQQQQNQNQNQNQQNVMITTTTTSPSPISSSPKNQFEEMSLLIAKLSDCVSNLPKNQPIPQNIQSQISDLISFLSSKITKK